MGTQLFVGGYVYTPNSPDATAIAITNGVVSWIGTDDVATALHPGVKPVQLDGAFLSPAFVDAHVHLTSTGLALDGLDLSDATSRVDCLERLHAYVDRQPAGEMVWGLGWDSSRWSDHTPPTTSDIDAIVGERPVYLARIDEHSALASSALRVIAAGLADAQGFDPEGPLAAEAHHLVRGAARELLTPEQRERAQRRALDSAAAHGVVAVHENGGPDISGLNDFAAIAHLDHPVRVRRYWGQAVCDADQAHALMAGTGADGLAGDLFIDGAIGSHTAWLTEPYSDSPHTCGVTYLDEHTVLDHLRACTQARIQAGFHLIGDGATACFINALRTVIGECGSVAVAACAHRIEHAEMLDEAAAQLLASAGVIVSMQPLFDALWGGPGELYEQRLGSPRGQQLNDFAALTRVGATVTFSSDSPVTGIDPWAQIQAAVNHNNPASAISPRAAFAACTRAGWRAAGERDPMRGTLVPGAPADFAVWSVGELVTVGSSAATARWSTDPRSRVPALPDVSARAPLPVCLATYVGGTQIFREGRW